MRLRKQTKKSKRQSKRNMKNKKMLGGMFGLPFGRNPQTATTNPSPEDEIVIKEIEVGIAMAMGMTSAAMSTAGAIAAFQNHCPNLFIALKEFLYIFMKMVNMLSITLPTSFVTDVYKNISESLLALGSGYVYIDTVFPRALSFGMGLGLGVAAVVSSDYFKDFYTSITDKNPKTFTPEKAKLASSLSRYLFQIYKDRTTTAAPVAATTAAVTAAPVTTAAAAAPAPAVFAEIDAGIAEVNANPAPAPEPPEVNDLSTEAAGALVVAGSIVRNASRSASRSLSRSLSQPRGSSLLDADDSRGRSRDSSQVLGIGDRDRDRSRDRDDEIAEKVENLDAITDNTTQIIDSAAAAGGSVVGPGLTDSMDDGAQPNGLSPDSGREPSPSQTSQTSPSQTSPSQTGGKRTSKKRRRTNKK